MSSPTVIIPAHNESAVIVRCLQSVYEAYPAATPEVIVVANNCSDDTARKAREFDARVKVIETPIGSKVHALNLGDEAATRFPRFYVDADITLEKGSLVGLCEELEKPGVLAVFPRASVVLEDRWWGIRAYYRVWRQMIQHRTGMVGSGVYGLGAEGRARFDKFPDITADDNYVRLQFSPSERKTVEACRSYVVPPKTLSKIVDIKTRSHFGNAELKQKFPQLGSNEDAVQSGTMTRLALNPLWWPAIGVYAYVKLETRRRVRKRMQAGDVREWERDETSREPSPTGVES